MNRDVMKIPVFARMFEQAPVLFWPILWFNLMRLARWLAGNGAPSVFLSVNGWGKITVIRAPVPKSPQTTYRPLADYIDQPTHLPGTVLARLAARPRIPAWLNLCTAFPAAGANAPASAFDSSWRSFAPESQPHPRPALRRAGRQC